MAEMTANLEHSSKDMSHEEHLRETHLMLDPKPRGEMNAMAMEAMHHSFASMRYLEIMRLATF